MARLIPLQQTYHIPQREGCDVSISASVFFGEMRTSICLGVYILFMDVGDLNGLLRVSGATRISFRGVRALGAGPQVSRAPRFSLSAASVGSRYLLRVHERG